MPLYLKRYDEPGHTHFWTISCYRRLSFFWHDGMKQVAIGALRKLQVECGICLIGYVIMLDHLHVILYPHERGCDSPMPIGKLLHVFKKHVAYHGKEFLRNYWRAHGRLWSSPLMKWATDADSKRQILYGRGYDFNICRQDTLFEKLDYCHKNPVTRQMVDHPMHWPWSSYRFYEQGDRSILSMDWDGRWPIIW